MIYITGDIHGNPSRLEPASLRERGMAIVAILITSLRRWLKSKLPHNLQLI